MGRRFHAADYNLVANPSLPKSNSSLPIWGLLIACAIVIAVSWQFFTPEIRLTRPILAFTPEKITATTEVTNRADMPATLEIRFELGTKGMDTEYGSGQFSPVSRQDIWATIPPHSTAPVVCSFPKGTVAAFAEARVLQQR